MPARIELRPRTPWILRPFDAVALPPLAVGIGIGLALWLLFWVYTAALGAQPGRLPDVAAQPQWLSELLLDLFVGLPLVVAAYSVRGTLRDFEALRPHLAGTPDEREARRLSILRHPPLVLGLAGLVGGALVVWLTYLGDVFPSPLRWSHPAAAWLVARNFLNGWAVTWAMALELELARAFSGLAERLEDVDLLDPGPLAPFARRALRSVVLWMLLAVYLSFLYAGRGWASDVLWVGIGSLTAFALSIFLLPLAGVHRRIQREKRSELARIRTAIGAERERLLAENPSRSEIGRLSDLLAYEQRIERVREWPVDASTLARLALYLTIGLGSWVGAALVERALATALP